MRTVSGPGLAAAWSSAACRSEPVLKSQPVWPTQYVDPWARAGTASITSPASRATSLNSTHRYARLERHADMRVRLPEYERPCGDLRQAARVLGGRAGER